MELKTCNTCKGEFELDKFYKRAASPGGYDCNCKSCRNEINKRTKKDKPKTEEQKKKAVEYVRSWRMRNPDKAKEMTRKTRENWSEERREAVRLMQKKYRENAKLKKINKSVDNV